MERQYSEADKYWSSVDATIDGMLGGFAAISPADLQDSKKLLQLIYKLENCPGKNRGLDCGAGIGRITKNLLKRHLATVDLVEQNKNFIEAAVKYVGEDHQVWSLTQFYSVDFSKWRISVKKCVFYKRTIKVCVSFCGVLGPPRLARHT